MDANTRRSLERLAAEHRAAGERLDDAIRAAIADGASLRDVAKASGLSHGGVAKIRDR